jgi:glycolate oxidase iron-sulfur subunit
MRALETGELPESDPTVVEQASFCLGCRACEPVCPAGVEYGELLEEWRDYLWSNNRPMRLRMLLGLTRRRWRVRTLGLLRRHARSRAGDGGPQLFLGCFERALFPSVSRSAANLVPAAAVTDRQGCCGALHAHNGELEAGREMARAVGEDLPGVILTTSGGCAAHLASVLGAERVRELSQWLSANPPPYERSLPGLRVALQDSCHLRNGNGVWEEPRALLAQLAQYVELPSAAECCGAAGTYAILRPNDSRDVLDRKLDEIAAAELDYVVVVNPGCLRQLQQGLKRRRMRTEAIHLADLIAQTTAR